jgi:hypothetical protein
MFLKKLTFLDVREEAAGGRTGEGYVENLNNSPVEKLPLFFR